MMRNFLNQFCKSMIQDLGNIERTCNPLNAGTKYTPSELFTEFAMSTVSASLSIKPEIKSQD